VPQAPATKPEPEEMPPLEFEGDAEGDLPEELELEEPPVPVREPEPQPSFPQPVDISLNES
jgi:hypothetical protein